MNHTMEEWWAQWREADYSWHGLSRKRWVGWSVSADQRLVETEVAPPEASPASLQDYWREEETSLIEETDAKGNVLRQWTRVHCPFNWENGSSTGKAEWSKGELNEISEVLAKKLIASAETVFETGANDRRIKGPDRRAQLQGAVLFEVPTLSGVASICFQQTLFARSAKLSGITLARGAQFTKACFGSEVHFESSHFAGPAWFDRTTFCAGANFEKAKFGGSTDFEHAVFLREARFASAQFKSGVRFAWAKFSETAWFEHATFNTVANFQHAQFLDVGNFSRISVTGGGWFEDAHFSDNCRFDHAAFMGRARFVRSQFLGRSDFECATFTGSATFERARFAEFVTFSGSHFAGDAWFKSAELAAGGSFGGVRFDGLPAFQGALLHSDLTFDGSKFTALNPVAFRAQAIFWCLLTLATCSFLAGTLLGGLGGVLLLSGAALAALTALIWSVIGGRIVGDDRVQERQIRAFRHLTLVSEKARNRRDAALFYRLELQVARLRWNTNPFERCVSWLYDIAAGYGESLVRPLVSLVMLTASSALAFAPSLATDDLLHALRFSLLNVLKPMHVWTTEFSEALRTLGQRAGGDPYWVWVAGLFEGRSPLVQVGLRLGATLESFAAVALLFLLALAIRRRFQIS